MSEEMKTYIDRCNRLGLRVNGAVVRLIAKRTHEDTNWFDASVCTNPNCDKHQLLLSTDTN